MPLTERLFTIDENTEFGVYYYYNPLWVRSIIFLPGFNDYFCNMELVELLQKASVNVFAILPRHYGKLKRPDGVGRFYIANIDAYFREIDETIEFIDRLIDPHCNSLYMCGFSTGGLTAISYCTAATTAAAYAVSY